MNISRRSGVPVVEIRDEPEDSKGGAGKPHAARHVRSPERPQCRDAAQRSADRAVFFSFRGCPSDSQGKKPRPTKPARLQAGEGLLRVAKNSATNPITSTPPSKSTDARCSLSNSARRESLLGVASTEPIWLRSTAILGIT